MDRAVRLQRTPHASCRSHAPTKQIAETKSRRDKTKTVKTAKQAGWSKEKTWASHN